MSLIQKVISRKTFLRKVCGKKFSLFEKKKQNLFNFLLLSRINNIYTFAPFLFETLATFYLTFGETK